ncbi:MAG TPA: ribosome maturation factor RimM [Candidatus Polarisedimenticolia bacterium]|nr:ribosome maturation factor RimM [Candidatus Polarisedimenticolia bacterium]
MAEDGYILIAEVDRVRGLRGEVVVTVHADDPSRMARLATVFMREAGGAWKELAVEGVKRLGERAVVKLSGYGTVEEARTLLGKELFIPLEASTPAPPGRYYAYQLEGLAVTLKDGSPVGAVREVLSQGAQSLLVVDGPRGEILIPLVAAICTDIDPDRGVVVIDPPEGLVELNPARPPRG